MQHIAPGYIFCAYWRFHQNIKTPQSHVLLQSLVISYVLNQVIYIIQGCFRLNINVLPVSILFSLLSAFTIGRLADLNFIQWLFDKLGIRRTLNDSIWVDLIDSERRNNIKIFDDDGYYVGTCVAYEDDQREPYIILEGYERCDLEGNTIIPANLSGDRKSLFNLKDFKRVEVVYSEG